MAPELMEGKEATFKSDVWAFGLCMYELLTWRLPWRECETPFQVGGVAASGTLAGPCCAAERSPHLAQLV